MTHAQTTCPNLIALHADKKRARRAKVWSLAPVFKNQLHTSNLKKIIKCKSTIQIATFDVGTLFKIGQTQELTAYPIYHNIDIICIIEHIYIHREDIGYYNTGNGWTLVSASAEKNSVKATIDSVGMLIGPRALKSLNNIEKIKQMMIVATWNSSATIISCYSPITRSEETDLITFYNKLSSLARNISKHNVLVIGGDMNTQIGKNVNSKFCLQSSSNRNGEHVTLNRFSYLNTKFKKKRENYGPTPTH